MKNRSVIVRRILSVFIVLSLFFTIFHLYQIENLRLSKSFLDTINEMDWSNTDFFVSKNLTFTGKVEGEYNFFGGFKSPNGGGGMIMVSPIEGELPSGLKKHKDIKYSASVYPTESFLKTFFSKKAEVMRMVDIYFEKYGFYISIGEVNARGNDCAFYDFFSTSRIQ